MFKRNLITGLLVLSPIGASLWIILWAWNLLNGLTNALPDTLRPHQWLVGAHPALHHLLDFALTLVWLALIVTLIWFVGAISSNYLGKKLLSAISKFFMRLPVVNTVYSTLEQLLKTFSSGSAKNFRRVVQIEYPRKGLYTLAFVTGEQAGLLTIYVPTTPNPTSGFYLKVAPDEVKEAKISVEEALKEIISMGIVHRGG